MTIYDELMAFLDALPLDQLNRFGRRLCMGDPTTLDLNFPPFEPLLETYQFECIAQGNSTVFEVMSYAEPVPFVLKISPICDPTSSSIL